jgi:anaerobic selenocysteine-containing dehydrogenase
MTRSISRRDFLKIVAAGAGASVSLGGCGRYLPGLDGQGAGQPVVTTCAECPAGCSLLAHSAGARLLHLDANPASLFYAGQACPGAQAAVEKLVSPARFSGARRQFRSEAGGSRPVSWADAIRTVASALRSYRPDELAFVLGLFPDHLNDLVQMLAQALGGASVLRFDPLVEFEGRLTLMDAVQRVFGLSKIPYFDLPHAGVIFSFGSSFQESWLGPVAGAVRYGCSPRDGVGPDSYLVHFDCFRSTPVAWADESIQIRPGSQTILAQALAARVARLKVGSSSYHHQETADLEHASQATGIGIDKLEYLARLFYQAERKLALPGGTALAGADGAAAAESILGLNLLAGNLGRPGGLFLVPEALLHPWLASRPSSVAELQGLVERMRNGQVKALFVHGVDLVASLPASFGLRQALECVEQVFSFASLPDETSRMADYILPDHLALESWGYQKTMPAADRPAVAALQPAVQPILATRASADVLLAAFHLAGGSTAAMPFTNELDFVKQGVACLVTQGGAYRAPDAVGFWQLWQQHGGWWQPRPCLFPPVQICSLERWSASRSEMLTNENGDYPFHLALTPQAVVGKTHAELQVEIHPKTAQALGVRNGKTIKLVSPAGRLQAKVRLNSQLAPDTLMLPWSAFNSALDYRRHTSSCNPLDLLGTQQNSSGNLAIAGLRVRLEVV